MTGEARTAARNGASIAVLFIVSGVLHLVTPRPYERIVPAPLPHKRALVYASGVAELACAAGLLHRRTRHLAGLASAAVLVGVFPANVQMALDSRRGGSRLLRLGMLVRLPVQVPLVRAALRAARG